MIRTLLISTLFLFSGLANAQRQYEYKCWVTLASGQQIISFQKLDTKAQHSQAKRLLMKGKMVHTGKGAKPLREVHECVELHRSFINMKARELDQQTVR